MEDGAQAARERAVDVDRALAALVEGIETQPSFALVAVGGYGRGELSPHSDIDLLFVVPPRREINKASLRGLLYPLWDAGFQVGHAVRTAKDAVEKGRDDLDAATSLLSARPIAGDESLFGELVDRRERWIGKDRKALVRRILDARTARHRRVERAGWVLAPDLKEDAGGLRDLHTAQWIDAVVDGVGIPAELAAAGAALLATREALHAETKRKTDRLHIDLQPRVAARLGLGEADGADVMMATVHPAARTIEYQSALFCRQMAETVTGGPKRSGATRTLEGGVQLRDGALYFDKPNLVDVVGAMSLIAARAETGRPIAPNALPMLRSRFAATADAWSPGLRDAFLRVLRAGPGVVEALEQLDHADAWPGIMPEWNAVRGRAQHDPYHRYTVDFHLFVTVAEIHRAMANDPVAARAADEAGHLDNLLIGALLHDIGKGSGEDHSVAGERLARAVATRMGFPSGDVEEIAALARHHLLLVDTATRRDIDDGAVVAVVAETIPDARLARLLYVLSVADGNATGPEGWNEWKAALVRELYRKVVVALETGEIPARSDVNLRAQEIEAYEPALAGHARDILATLPPSYLQATSVPDMTDDLRLLTNPPGRGEVRHRIDPGTEPGEVVVTVCVVDRPGTLARTAGVLALHRISVLRAQAYSTTTGLALERFIVTTPPEPAWDAFEHDLDAAYSGRLALEARLDRKIKDYAEKPTEPEVRVLNDESAHSTVIEVRSRDALGLLFAIASALSDLDLDIHVAKIDTLGSRVVDVFYVRNMMGGKLSDEQTAEVARAIEHRIARTLG